MATYAVNPDAVAHCRDADREEAVRPRQRLGRASSPAPTRRTPSSSGTRWEEYAAWHLGLTEGATDETKARYAFVYGDLRRVHRTAPDRLRLPRVGVAAQGGRARRARPAAAARPGVGLTRARRGSVPAAAHDGRDRRVVHGVRRACGRRWLDPERAKVRVTVTSKPCVPGSRRDSPCRGGRRARPGRRRPACSWLEVTVQRWVDQRLTVTEPSCVAVGRAGGHRDQHAVRRVVGEGEVLAVAAGSRRGPSGRHRCRTAGWRARRSGARRARPR